VSSSPNPDQVARELCVLPLPSTLVVAREVRRVGRCPPGCGTSSLESVTPSAACTSRRRPDFASYTVVPCTGRCHPVWISKINGVVRVLSAMAIIARV